MVVTVFNGSNIATWTSWVWWALGIEIFIIWVYTVSSYSILNHWRLICGLQAVYSTIKPGWFPTYIYGNDHFLFHSALYWLGLFLVVPLALVPHIALKAYRFIFHPTDIETVRYLHKIDPGHDFGRDRENGGVDYLKRNVSMTRGVRRKSILQGAKSNPRMGSRTDMATGLRTTTNTGFDFSMEENGVALRRLQSNLSGVQPAVHHKRRRSLLHSIGRTIRRKKVPSTVTEETEPIHSPPSVPKP